MVRAVPARYFAACRQALPQYAPPGAAGTSQPDRAQQTRPFGFFITPTVRAFDPPLGRGGQPFHLVAPFETDGAKWASDTGPSSRVALTHAQHASAGDGAPAARRP
jgi:hypothetical protein